jgi:hypothetical protein
VYDLVVGDFGRQAGLDHPGQPPQAPLKALVRQARAGQFIVQPAGCAGHRTTDHL